MQGIKPALPLSVLECFQSVIWFIVFRDLLYGLIALVWRIHPDPNRHFSAHLFLENGRIPIKLGRSSPLDAFNFLGSLGLGAYLILEVLEMLFGDSLNNKVWLSRMIKR